jgi:hypothetical protein
MEYFKITDSPSLNTSDIIKQMKSKFSVWLSNDDLAFWDTNFPAPNKETTRYFKRLVEADPENADKSAEDCDKEGIQGITLRERLLMEIQHFDETGEHLDLKNVTLCSGSRDRASGNVPYVHFSRGFQQVFVLADWSFVRRRYPRLRVRSAVSLESNTLVPLTPEVSPEIRVETEHQTQIRIANALECLADKFAPKKKRKK